MIARTEKEVPLLKIKDFIHHFNLPCDECPYKLGLVQTLINPCPLCKENNYQMFERFRQDRTVNDRKEQSVETSCYSSNE